MAIIYFASETSGDKWDAFKGVAMNYDKFGFAHVTDAALATANNSAIGRIALFKPFDEKRNDYEGEIKFEPIRDFVDAAKLATVMEFDETAIEVVF
jgi:protein disulfide-isomerase A1